MSFIPRVPVVSSFVERSAWRHHSADITYRLLVLHAVMRLYHKAEVSLVPLACACVFYFLFRVESFDNYVLLVTPAQCSKNSKHAPRNVIGSQNGRSDMGMRNLTGNCTCQKNIKTTKLPSWS